jgi:hypothetical protein
MISAREHERIANTTLEFKLTNAHCFGLTTASPLQRAICRIADGEPLEELTENLVVRRAIGDTKDVNGIRPRELAIVSGIRTAKSLFAAASAYHWSQVCDVSRLGPGETPRVSVVSLKKDLADVVYQHLVGRLKESALLRETFVAQPSAETVVVKHPSGRDVEIKVVAGSRAGASLVARWSAGCVFDEFARMQGAGDAVVNWDHEREAVLYRLLDGAQIIHISSPWAPFGPAYNLVTEHWQKPTRALVVVKAPAFDMNPVLWTKERVEEAKANDRVYQTDVLANFTTQEESLFAADAVASSVSELATIPYEEGCHYNAAMDPATRGNGWTLVVTTRKGRQRIVAYAAEWVGNARTPLNPREVMREIADILAMYNVAGVESDCYYIDPLVQFGRECGITVTQRSLTDKQMTAFYLELRTRIESGEVTLAKNDQLRTDLVRVRKRVSQNGVKIDLPHTSDGRHCDFAPSTVLALSRYLADVDEPHLARKRGALEEQMFQDLRKKFGKRTAPVNPWTGAR